MSEQNVGEAPAPLPREPNVHSGGEQEPGGLVPPYEGRQESGPTQEEQAQDPQKQGEGSAAGPRVVSDAEREGVSPTDTTGASPLGVGESVNKPGQERMYGKPESAHQADQFDKGVGGQEPNVHPDSPDVLTGDQGG